MDIYIIASNPYAHTILCLSSVNLQTEMF